MNLLHLDKDFAIELKAYEKLSELKHENVMDYYGFKTKKEGCYFFFEFCGGGSLKDYASSASKSHLKLL